MDGIAVGEDDGNAWVGDGEVGVGRGDVDEVARATGVGDARGRNV